MTSRIDRLTYAIGDIHGYDELFERLLDRIRVDAETLGEKPRVVLLGDYIDRGPASRQVLERIRRLLTATWCDAVVLKGNHEDALLRFLREPEFGDTWREWGGGATLASYGVTMPYLAHSADVWHDVRDAFVRSVDMQHVDMLRDLPVSFHAGDYFFVHAGVNPDLPLQDQDGDTFMYIRGRFLRSEKACDYVVVHGHTPSPEPESVRWRIGVDTGIYFTGVLTAVRLRGRDRDMIQVRQDI
ncbi:MAG: metallophosphoesterase family protein [Asticcacaulis sp.]